VYARGTVNLGSKQAMGPQNFGVLWTMILKVRALLLLLLLLLLLQLMRLLLLLPAACGVLLVLTAPAGPHES